MQISEYKNIFENEESHFFYVANHKIILSLLNKYLTHKSKIKILDAGCGTGLLTKKLKMFGDVTGLDYSKDALSFAKMRGIKTKLGSVTKLPFPDNSFDAVVSIDVIAHEAVQPDTKAIKEFNRVLKHGGILLIRVSANKWLHLKHDEHVYTVNRYSLRELKGKLQRNKFSVLKISYTNMALLPLAILRMLFEKVSNKGSDSAVGSVPPFINKIMTTALSIEAFLLRYYNLPFGIALISVSRKPLRN